MAEDLQAGFERIFGRPLQPLTPPQVLQLLQSGPQDLVVVLHWSQEMPQHQLVLHGLTEDRRVVFYNPYRAGDEEVGTELNDPPRRVEPDGLESVTFDTFRSFFTERKAVCFNARPG